MLQTIEVRWFGQGHIPGNIKAWFDSLSGEPLDQPPRQDLYLQPIHDSGLSLKLREGGLEVKQRQASHGLVAFGRSVAGLVERWSKWRFPLDSSLFSPESIPPAPRSWLAVDKQRRLKHYLLDETGAVRPVAQPPAAAEAEDPGAQTLLHLELAAVQAGHKLWWTIACEASLAGESSVRQFLAITTPHFAENAPNQLSEANSFGYPHWLSTCLPQH